ncbi:hypothetical protein BRADI_1g02840v3 [Brachypodium distachyon]|uniref:BTB domain-containing protein n=2 Tax=Brachypodium distachyon TaxID=15368 RepID=A0A0Q3J2Y4_BRADI|nr:hypothetical protein BRADI_1g02840v3 [Brachypodium distachyon]
MRAHLASRGPGSPNLRVTDKWAYPAHIFQGHFSPIQLARVYGHGLLPLPEMAERMAADGESSVAAAAEAEMKMECFDFAFNSERFSDRLLRIEVVASDDIAEGFLPDCTRHRKDKGDKRQRIASSPTMADTPVLRVKTLHINSAILAARSSFFLKLFSNGMKESDQTQTTIRISDSEENAFMELLSFMYSGKLMTTEPSLLLDILMSADKFEVPSCMRHCSQLLISLPMTTESALLYLEHRCSISMTAEVQLVIGAAKQFLANKFRDFDEFYDEAMKIPLAGIEVIFSNNDLHVHSEDDVYNFLLRWARAQYPESEERRKILSSRLLPLVRFSHMPGLALQEILMCTDTDIDHDQITKLVTEVLLQKGYPAQLEGALGAPAMVAERAYASKPMKMVAFDQPCRQVIVYWDLTFQECSRLFPSGEIYSHRFYLAGQEFCLVAACESDEENESHGFCIYLGISNKPEGSPDMTVDFEFSASKRSPRKFDDGSCSQHTFTDDPECAFKGLFCTPWLAFIADDSLFIDGVLHMRSDLAVVEQPQLQT